jgi:putative ATP-dependent endonuclease of the OLD family
MYISEIRIKNYRNFKENNILFTPELNIIIGHNNSGKTNLINALQLVLDKNFNKKLSIDDFSKEYADYSKPPTIEISVFINEYMEQKDDKNVVYDWLIQDTPQYKAQLTYIFKLPTKHHDEYTKLIENCRDENGNFIQESCLKVISKIFLPQYVTYIYGGNPSKEEKADSERLYKFDFQFLNAIRDAERQMFFGSNTLLRDVLNYFLDYDLTSGQGFENLSEQQINDLKERENEFKTKSNQLLKILINRIDKENILQYSKDTGAAKGGVPNFDAEITEKELLFALRLIVEKYGFKIPIKYNGLGYNNLLFIALILAKMQMESSSYMGDNAKVFPILAIEEPEAHLHPSMQSKFLKFLKSNLNTQKQARQIFITSHSTHITSAVDLDSIICLYQDIKNDFKVGYPARTFSNSKEDISSKIYVQRFLDATKSNMLFADSIFFVEGLAEQLLLPCLAQYLGIEDKLIDKHISIISVNSRTFKHFLKIFSYDNTNNSYAINKKIICITDSDPTIKINNKWVSTFPFFLNDTEDRKPLSMHILELKNSYEKQYKNIFIFHPISGYSKTFEYEIAKENPTSELLITDSFPKQNSAHTGSNFKDILDLYSNSLQQIIDMYKNQLGIKEIQDNELLAGISKCKWDEEDKKKALIAAIYYKIVGNSKGEHAFYLEQNLRENFDLEKDKKKEFTVPLYIKEALNKMVEDDEGN